MSSGNIEPKMCWEKTNLVETFRLFRQQCELYLKVRRIPEEEWIDHILLLVGAEGLKRYNSWTFEDEEDKRKPEIIWQKFLEELEGLEPLTNFRIARFYLQKYTQRDDETIMDFLTRCKQQARKCNFRDERDTEEHLIDLLIAGTRYPELQQILLSKNKEMSLQEVIDISRGHEASINNMRKMGELQRKNEIQEIDAIKHKPSQIECRKCGLTHQDGRCPARNSICSACGRRSHWAKMCHNRRDRNDRQPQTHWPRRQSNNNNSRSWRHQNAIQLQDQVEDDFEAMSFYTIETHSPRKARTEVFATLDVTLPNKRGVHTLKAKVDTGAEGNTLPLRTFQQMFPERIDPGGLPLPGSTHKETAVLTAYNGSNIIQHGSITINCAHKGEWRAIKFFIVTSEGPVIIGLPSLKELKLVTLHCAIQKTKYTPVNSTKDIHLNSTKDLIETYPEQFDRLGDFAGEYHIVLKPDNHPIIHAPRKCPIHMRDEIKSELDDMTENGIIRKVAEPTDWVSSIVYVRKSNGKLRLCLDPKDLNKDIMRCHHRTPTLEELTHKLSGAKFFSKLDAKNGYWSVKLDQESQLLTTFNSPFGRYCFRRMPFGLVMSQDVFQQKMDMILEGCPGTLALIDDVIVYGKNKQEHNENLKKLMETAQTTGLTFNSSKCAVNQEQIKFFGAILDKDGIHPDPKKVEEIKALPSPTGTTELQKILGIINYMAPFIPRLSDLTAGLRDLLKKDKEFA